MSWQWLSDLINNALEAVRQFLINLLNTFWEMLKDIVIFLLEAVLQAVVYIFSLIPVPEFISEGLGASMGSFTPLLIYFMDKTGFDYALLIIASGVTFRLTRKFVTLFQW